MRNIWFFFFVCVCKFSILFLLPLKWSAFHAFNIEYLFHTNVRLDFVENNNSQAEPYGCDMKIKISFTFYHLPSHLPCRKIPFLHGEKCSQNWMPMTEIVVESAQYTNLMLYRGMEHGPFRNEKNWNDTRRPSFDAFTSYYYYYFIGAGERSGGWCFWWVIVVYSRPLDGKMNRWMMIIMNINKFKFQVFISRYGDATIFICFWDQIEWQNKKNEKESMFMFI